MHFHGYANLTLPDFSVPMLQFASYPFSVIGKASIKGFSTQ